MDGKLAKEASADVQNKERDKDAGCLKYEMIR